ncbi:hypothetical protein LTR66_014636 [Elasticomyces elasticus]|nr:hypothetical protein LTR66_014636 [Elasticomyces elasticus]
MSLYNPKSTNDFGGLLKVSPLPYQLSQSRVTYLDDNAIGVMTVGRFTNVPTEKPSGHSRLAERWID